jgi:outer membrane protein assembly factor BamB
MMTGRFYMSGLTALALLFISLGAEPNPAAERAWPQWRGPHNTGVSRHANPPVEWSETKNVRWKIEIPGRGAGSPVIWGDRLFLLTAVPVGEVGTTSQAAREAAPVRDVHRYAVMAIDRGTGKVIWSRTAREAAPHEGVHHQHGTWASTSAITDGEHVIASFESRGLYAYDMNGTLVWETDLGDKRMRNEFGEGSTPALHGNTLVQVWDHQGQSFIVALDKRTGKELWRKERDEIDSWATPLIVEHNGRAQVVTSAMNQVRSYDLETGELVWHSEGLTMNPIPSPVAGDGMVFVTSGFRGNKLQAIRLAEARGDLSRTNAIAWTLDRDTPYVPSPLLYDRILYILKSNSGILSAYDAATGKAHYELQRLEGVPNVFASPVGAGGRLYIAGQDGKTIVLRHGPQYEVLATNALDDGFNASPALVDDAIYLRGHRYLYAIGEGK